MTASATHLDHLARHVRGPVHLPGTEGYADARSGFQRALTHRPAVVAEALDAADVGAAVRFATARGLAVAVQATGHGLVAPATGDAMLISTRRMDSVRVDPVARTAWLGAGVRWRRVLDATAAHGLAPLSGSSPGVGAVSYTLGGGLGPLARRYGYAADHVRRVELVTADGEVREVSADRTRTCSGRCAAAAATSASSPGWSSAWCPWRGSTAAVCSSTALTPPRCWRPTGAGRRPCPPS
ncbi:FAD-dependent oxidoreductase [Prauserella flavalba]|uniref:FAD-binding oxidoreductase n=1 Tax=Prauserella flavalba TaxID=1477506 RepID=UPI00268CBCBB